MGIEELVVVEQVPARAKKLEAVIPQREEAARVPLADRSQREEAARLAEARGPQMAKVVQLQPEIPALHRRTLRAT
jgi:hypothetical protein